MATYIRHIDYLIAIPYTSDFLYRFYKDYFTGTDVKMARLDIRHIDYLIALPSTSDSLVKIGLKLALVLVVSYYGQKT